MTEITLESFDGVLVNVNKEIVLQSELISDILKEKGNDIEEPIHLENIRYLTLNKVIEYCRHYNHELISNPYNRNINNYCNHKLTTFHNILILDDIFS